VNRGAGPLKSLNYCVIPPDNNLVCSFALHPSFTCIPNNAFFEEAFQALM